MRSTHSAPYRLSLKPGSIALAVLVAISALACTKGGKEPPATSAPPEPPPPIDVRADRKDLVFSFSTDGKRFETATTVDEIPADARKAVVVTDLSLSPDKRQSARYVYVADLSARRADGSFPVSVASRYGFEAAVSGTSTVASKSGRVVVYSASWCGVCKKAMRLLDQWGVKYVEKDVEASRSAQQELAQKAAAVGIRPSGVPVIDVGGVLLQGLDERTLRSALEQGGFL